VSWVFGAHGHNFVKTIIRLAIEREELRIVSDQHGCPTAAVDIAGTLLSISERFKETGSLPWGTYHYTGTPQTTWHVFAEQIVAIAKEHIPLHVERIIPITTTDYPTPAPRPQNSVLDCSKIMAEFDLKPVPWKHNLEVVVPQIISQ
jgi:dTDP-4-dehydrorhamnose reductase